MKNYRAIIVHFENAVQGQVGSVDMQGRARQILRQLKAYRSLLFMHLIQDILKCLAE